MSSSTKSELKWAYEFCPSDYTFIALIGMAVFVFAFAPGEISLITQETYMINKKSSEMKKIKPGFSQISFKP